MSVDLDFKQLMPFVAFNEKSLSLLRECEKKFNVLKKTTKDFTRADKKTESIEKIIHFVWLGPKDYPTYALSTLERWAQLNPSCDVNLWVDDLSKNASDFGRVKVKVIGQDFNMKLLQKEYGAQATYAGKSDILRLELLYEFGGVYSDYDNRCLKSVDILLDSCSFLGAFEWNDKHMLVEDPVTRELIEPRISNCIVGARSKSPVLKEAFQRMAKAHEFFAKISPQILCHQIIFSTYVHLGLAIASQLEKYEDFDCLILPSKLAWGLERGKVLSNYSERFFDINFLPSVGWNGEVYDFEHFRHALKGSLDSL